MSTPASSVNQPTAVDTVEAASEQKKLTVLETHGYHLGRTIGSGSYAAVRLAESATHETLVAIKIISKFQAPADYLRKFLPREIEVVKGLRHPNLIRFLQAIETTHRVYIIMEYAENGSLLEVIRRDGSIDEDRSRNWYRQIIGALDYCHERGVVHRDIKCENLLMDSEWNIKLTDFGFARGNMKPSNGSPVFSDTFCGSYAYASPEILRGIPYQPQMADIWSTGVVLYAMVFGRLPFDDSDYKELIKQVSSKVNYPKQPKVSNKLRSLINRILAPLKQRIRISGIKADAWFIFDDDAATNSRKSSILSEEEERRLSIDPNTLVPPNIITKEQLESLAKAKPKGRRDTLEEEKIKTENPDEDDRSRRVGGTAGTQAGKSNKKS